MTRGQRNALLTTASIAMLCVAAVQVRSWWHAGRRPDPSTYVVFHLACLSCGYEFDRTQGQMPDAARARFINTAAIRVTCPKCGEVQAAVMRQCPQCGKLYVSAWTRGVRLGEGRDVCPRCGTDVTARTRGQTPLQTGIAP